MLRSGENTCCQKTQKSLWENRCQKSLREDFPPGWTSWWPGGRPVVLGALLRWTYLIQPLVPHFTDEGPEAWRAQAEWATGSYCVVETVLLSLCPSLVTTGGPGHALCLSRESQGGPRLQPSSHPSGIGLICTGVCWVRWRNWPLYIWRRREKKYTVLSVLIWFIRGLQLPWGNYVRAPEALGTSSFSSLLVKPNLLWPNIPPTRAVFIFRNPKGTPLGLPSWRDQGSFQKCYLPGSGKQ